MVNSQYFLSSTVRWILFSKKERERERKGEREKGGREWECFLSGLCPLTHSFESRVELLISLWPFRVWSVGVMSFATVRRGVRKASVCRCLEGRSLEPCFFKRQGTGRKALRKGKLYPLLLALCVVLKRHSLDCTPTMNDHNYSCISSREPQGKIRKGKTMNCSGILLQYWVDLSPILEGSCSKPSCSLLSRLISL